MIITAKQLCKRFSKDPKWMNYWIDGVIRSAFSINDVIEAMVSVYTHHAFKKQDIELPEELDIKAAMERLIKANYKVK